jgi:hypothetical protein
MEKLQRRYASVAEFERVAAAGSSRQLTLRRQAAAF